MSLGTVFFSNSCPHSRRFMQLLESKPDLVSRFAQTDKQEDFKEYGIQYTPSIRLADGTVKSGQEAFAFIGESPTQQPSNKQDSASTETMILGLSLKTWIIIAIILLGSLYMVKKFGLFNGNISSVNIAE